MRFSLFLPLALVATASAPALAESADHYRGGWRTETGGPHTYQFVIDGSKVSGFHCTHCDDATTISPLDGTFDPEKGIAFTVRHLELDGTLDHQDKATALLDDGKLRVTVESGSTDGGESQHVAIKDPRGPAPSYLVSSMLPPGAVHPAQLQRPAGYTPPPPAPYADPGGWRQLSPADVIGVWIGFGTGRDKQYFIIRPDDRGGLYGLACGPCDNPYTMGALENFRFDGDTVHFDIVHQDWGEGPTLPFHRHVAAKVGRNEMRMDARRSDWPEDRGIVASLIGPISLEATQGNGAPVEGEE